jgi:CelD/BcsL family acetyltransferase involved in cellulose biosynthesis
MGAAGQTRADADDVGKAASVPEADRRRRPRPDGPLRVEVVTDLADLESLEAPWASLLHSSPAATAYASAPFVTTWYRHFERPGGIYVVTVWRGAELVGLAPFARTRLGRNPAEATLLVSAGTEHGDYGEPLLGPDPGPVAVAIADHLAEVVRKRTVVNMRRLREDCSMLAALETHGELARAPMGEVARAAVVRFDQIEDPEVHLRRLAKKHSVPRRLRRLAEAHGDVEYVPDSPDLTAALDTMRDMLARRWGPDAGPSLFRAPRLEAFTREVMRQLADSGLGRVATMAAGGRPLAVSTVLEIDDRQVSDNAAFDPDLAEFGPGQAEMHMMLRHAHHAGATEVDLRAGDFPYKDRWANTTHITRSLALTAPGRERDVMMCVRRLAMSRRARRLARLREQLPVAFGTEDRRRWLLAIAVALSLLSGSTDAVATVA